LFGGGQVIIRSVRLFSGLAPERDGTGGSPLSEITVLCGLRLGGEDASEDWLLGGDDRSGFRDQAPQLRLVAGTDVETGPLNELVDPQGLCQGVMREHAHRRLL